MFSAENDIDEKNKEGGLRSVKAKKCRKKTGITLQKILILSLCYFSRRGLLKFQHVYHWNEKNINYNHSANLQQREKITALTTISLHFFLPLDLVKEISLNFLNGYLYRW